MSKLPAAVFCLAAAVMVCSVNAATLLETAGAPLPQATFYQRGAEGWFWYHDPMPEQEEPAEDLPEPAPPVPPVRPVEGANKTSTTPPPSPFSLSWVKAMLPKYMETAWNNPTKENVEAYFLVQRFALDRANAFADMAQRVVVGNLALDETMRRPTSGPGATAANLQYADNVRQQMKKIAEHAGLWFFFKSSCRFCEAQAPILGFLEQEGFSVLAVSMDGGALKSRQFANTYVDQGQAEQLGVTATPALYLVSADGTFDALGMSVLTLDDLRSRILLVGARNGWISEEELQEASPLINTSKQLDLSKQLPQLLKASADPSVLLGNDQAALNLQELAASQAAGKTGAPDLQGLLSEDNFIAPEKLIDLVGGHRAGRIAGFAGGVEAPGEGSTAPSAGSTASFLSVISSESSETSDTSTGRADHAAR